jgi:hypothetical protein
MIKKAAMILNTFKFVLAAVASASPLKILPIGAAAAVSVGGNVDATPAVEGSNLLTTPDTIIPAVDAQSSPAPQSPTLPQTGLRKKIEKVIGDELFDGLIRRN